MEDYWREATALADVLLPIPPRVCLNANGEVIETPRCSQCPMLAQCKLMRKEVK